ncbi:MAG: branched-chain amino acid ABC transporter permease, partial [Candidatus Aminicenantes bacterium]|nr:branched-chain amino acid ABC transporter permease [Candidatus Aminicenantes bacterium]
MKKNLLLILILILFSLSPFLTSNNFLIRFLTDILIFSILASSWNIIGGYTGYASFGNVVFFGIGAYSTSILMSNIGLGFFVSMILGGIIAALFALLMGLPILRLKGHYFAIATLGVAEAIKALVQNLNITEGNSGIYLPQPEMSVDGIYTFFFYVTLIVLALLLFLTSIIFKNKFGYNLKAIRENEDSANSMGINTTIYKSAAFSLSGFFTGLAGGIYAFQQGFIKPEPVFNVLITIKMIVMSVFGGLGSLFGPLIGAFTIETISEFLSSYFLVAHTLFLGIIIILMILFAPKGMLDVFINIREKGLS